MKTDQVFAAFFTFTLFVAFSIAFAQEPSELTPKRVEPSDFAIYPWGGMPDQPFWGGVATGKWGDFADANTMMKDLYDCGFNVTGFTGHDNFKYARNNHLAVILTGVYGEEAGVTGTLREISQEEANKKIESLLEPITDLEDRKAVFAISLKDEPFSPEFPALSTWCEAVRKQGFQPYVNLNPGRVGQIGGYCGEGKDYPGYLDDYVKICKPPFISYDNYALFEDGRFDENYFYNNIEWIRKKALESGIPFWNVITSAAHYHYAEPSDATLAIQVYSTLAYGGRGIGYFTYYSVPHVNFRFAPIDHFGHRTKTWEMMRNINFQIHSIVPIYSKLISVNVFHTGNIPQNSQGIVSAKHVESISGESLLVGEFVDSDGKPYVLVVNKNTKSSVHFNVKFKDGGQVREFSSFNRGFTDHHGWLSPGCGMLLTVE